MFFSMSSVSRSLSAGAALASRGNLLDNRIKSPFLVSIRRCPLISTMEMLAWDARILILWESSRWRTVSGAGMLKVSGVSSHLSFCCTSLVSGLIIQEEARFVYWQTAQRINFVFVQC